LRFAGKREGKASRLIAAGDRPAAIRLCYYGIGLLTGAVGLLAVAFGLPGVGLLTGALGLLTGAMGLLAGAFGLLAGALNAEGLGLSHLISSSAIESLISIFVRLVSIVMSLVSIG
jgi:hypothetical protein